MAKPEIEKFSNKEEWEENILQEVGEAISIQIVLETPKTIERIKMTKENLVTIRIRFTTKNFQGHEKKKDNN